MNLIREQLRQTTMETLQIIMINVHFCTLNFWECGIESKDSGLKEIFKVFMKQLEMDEANRKTKTCYIQDRF